MRLEREKMRAIVQEVWLTRAGAGVYNVMLGGTGFSEADQIIGTVFKSIFAPPKRVWGWQSDGVGTMGGFEHRYQAIRHLIYSEVPLFPVDRDGLEFRNNLFFDKTHPELPEA